MAEQQPGLRFDIYERVHLQEDLAEIRELNDVELVPHIQVITLDQQAILKGNLLLTGSYLSQNSEEPRNLEHLIPVEITLPLNRIHRVEDILVEIENFDVDLLSARSLNVTGVLSLQGVEMVSAPIEDWREDEEVTFVHEAEEVRGEPAPQAEVQEPEQSQEPLQVPVQVEEPAKAPVQTQVPVPFPEQAAVQEPLDASPQPVSSGQEESAPEAEIVKAELEQEQTEWKVETDPEEGTVLTEEKKELKVAFGKKANEAVEIKPYGIKTLLSKAGALLQSEKKREDLQERPSLAEEQKADAVEWKRLFLQTDDGKQEFRKLRMCIVQKEETLETIAKRYQLNPRELQLLNRLGDQELTAGQVIYLPR